MALSEKKKVSNKKWDDANLDKITFKIKKGSKEKLKIIADKKEMSISKYIVDAVEKQYEQDTGIKLISDNKSSI